MSDRLRVGQSVRVVDVEAFGTITRLTDDGWVEVNAGGRVVARREQVRSDSEPFFLALDALDKLVEGWLDKGGKDHTAQLLVSRSVEGFEIGFVRYGDLRAKMAKGATLFDALCDAAKQLEDVAELDAEPPTQESIE